MTVHVYYRLKCGGNIDEGDFSVERFDQVPIILNLKSAFSPSSPPFFFSLSIFFKHQKIRRGVCLNGSYFFSL